MEKKDTKIQLIEMLIRRLMEYNGKESFTENEIEEIKTILHLLDCLDPAGKYLKASSAKINIGINHCIQNKEGASIISFCDKKKIHDGKNVH